MSKAVQEALRKAMGDASKGMSEKAALEAGMDVAEEWKMRLEELEEEDGDSE